MYRCPNDSYTRKSSKETSKKNQIGRKFSDIFDVLLDPSYYEGTPHGRHFKRLNPDGTSKIYVRDPLEDKLKDFCNMKSNTLNYLVGFTGMGKTTLLRNFFKVQDRDVHFEDDTLVIYISFYYANLNADHPQRSVENEVIKYLSRAITKLGQTYPSIVQNEDIFWNGLYEYIEQNKPVSLQNDEITPDVSLFSLFMPTQEKSVEQKKAQLIRACERNRLEYYSSMLKYILIRANSIHNVYFIFDDIESKEAVFHRPVVEVARHLHSCFSCTDGKDILLKTLVSLRAYTFRSNVDRQLEARREQIERNTIFKRDIVSLSKIFDARFAELQATLGTEEKAKVKTSYDAAVEQVGIVSRQIDMSFSPIILSLANSNLCNAMVMYNTILVNVEWIAKNEQEDSGGFQVSANSYRLTAKTVFRALACGNEVSYSDKYTNYFPNILHNGKEEGSELINLLILRYLIKKDATDLYGETYVQRSEIIQDIADVFISTSDSNIKIERWQERIIESLNYLYDSGVLLRSIYDIESLDNDLIERKYSRGFKLYVSPRGQYLFSLFSQNALLLELYRDSIYVDLRGNDRLTDDMRTFDVMQYLIAYVRKLFEYEKRNIGEAFVNLRKYQEYFGDELLISPLLEGIVKNICSYFRAGCEEYNELMDEIQLFTSNIKQYTHILSNDTGIHFRLSDYFKE